MYNILFIQVLDERGLANHHETFDFGLFETGRQPLVLLFSETAISVVCEFAVVRRIQKHEVILAIVGFEYVLKALVTYLCSFQ